MWEVCAIFASLQNKRKCLLCLICCFVKSLMKKLSMKIYWSPEKEEEKIVFYPSAASLCPWSCTGFTVLFKDTSAGWRSLPKGLQPGPSTVVEGQTLCSLYATLILQTNIQGQSNQMESHPRPRQQTEVEHLLQGCIQAHSRAQDKSRLTFPAAVSSDSDLAQRYRWDRKCPLDTAIKFHFEIMHAKVSLNPSQR